VPLGNVYYYYFKSKDELVAAAIDSYAQESRERLSWLEQQHRTPRARLKTLVRLIVSQSDQVALYGCPRGTRPRRCPRSGRPRSGKGAI